jgi:molybdopterin-containing oxidoreductase family iron-sulfur binding subunit
MSPGDLTRRDVMVGLAASIAAAAASGCTRAPSGKIVPYRVAPPEVIPGRPIHYATAHTIDGYATGLLVESHEGRPTKVEGNPDHPSSRGASGAWEQALILELYQPDRLRGVRREGAPATIAGLYDVFAEACAPARGGRGIHVVLAPTSSPVIADLLDRLRTKLPELVVHFPTPLSRARAWDGARDAFGSVLDVQPDLTRPDVIVSLDDDFLACGPAYLARAREFAERRRVRRPSDTMNRLYAVEAAVTVTGSTADHRLATRDSELPAVAAALLLEVAQALGGTPAPIAELTAASAAAAPYARVVRAIAADLVRHRGRALILAGDRQPAPVHAAAHALNALLGAESAGLDYVTPAVVDAGLTSHEGLASLAAALDKGAVDLVVALEADVLYASPSNLRLAELWSRARQSVSLGLFDDATSRASTWSVAAAHVLESWGDTCAHDGTATIVQPLIAPMYGGHTTTEVLEAMLGERSPSAHRLVKDHWRARHPNGFDAFWEQSLAAGTIEGTRSKPMPAPQIRWSFAAALGAFGARGSQGLEIALRADPSVLDGRFAGSAWLQELPDPVTKLTWGNAALLGSDTARARSVVDGDVVELQASGRTLQLPALVVPGHAEGVVSIALGYGRQEDVSHGGNGFVLATSDAPFVIMSASMRKTGRHEDLATTQHHFALEGHAESILLEGTLAEYREHPRAVTGEERQRKKLSLYPERPKNTKQQWGMAIDLSACTGCSACVVACQAENNVPSVGRDGVLKRREMHWLRIDRYHDGRRIRSQPMLCQHCEKAPCEYVCPTAATVHSTDGLNEMVYNRCVGTRFCSNNCPYKVRRFNWFDYHDEDGDRVALGRNPEVTVRARGVMEKCTYCVQRIRNAEIAKGGAGHPLRDGVVRTACEQACPTQAIVFGDLADPTSRVSQLQANDRIYSVLGDLGTAPRTRYLARLTNPNPELA